jgi:hypothetical protein
LRAGQVKGDGEPTVFEDKQETGIPALQSWCHTLTDSSRLRAARNFIKHLKTFGQSVASYVTSINDVSVADRLNLKEKWASDEPEDPMAVDPDLAEMLGMPVPKARHTGGNKGIMHLLIEVRSCSSFALSRILRDRRH